MKKKSAERETADIPNIIKAMVFETQSQVKDLVQPNGFYSLF